MVVVPSIIRVGYRRIPSMGYRRLQANPSVSDRESIPPCPYLERVASWSNSSPLPGRSCTASSSSSTRRSARWVASTSGASRICWPSALGGRSTSVEWIELGRRGKVPITPAPGYRWKETPRLNADVVAAAHDEDLESIVDRLERGYQDVMATIDALDDNELLEPRVFEWAGSYPISRWDLDQHRASVHHGAHLHPTRAAGKPAVVAGRTLSPGRRPALTVTCPAIRSPRSTSADDAGAREPLQKQIRHLAGKLSHVDRFVQRLEPAVCPDQHAEQAQHIDAELLLSAVRGEGRAECRAPSRCTRAVARRPLFRPRR